MECEQSLPVCVHSGMTCKVSVKGTSPARGTKYGISTATPVTASPSVHHDISLKALHVLLVAWVKP